MLRLQKNISFMKKIFTLSCLVLIAASSVMLSCTRERTGASYNCQCTVNVYVNGVVTETSVTNYAITSTDPENAQILCNSYDANLTKTGAQSGQTKSCFIK